MPQIATSGPGGTTVITFQPDQLRETWEALGYRVTLAVTPEAGCCATLHHAHGKAERSAVGASVGAALAFVTLAALDHLPPGERRAWSTQAHRAGVEVVWASTAEPWV